MPTSPIIKTRLKAPLLSERAIDRALTRHIGLPVPAKRLTLLTAPAGYGKTSLAAQWVALSGIAAVWLSLEKSDNVSRQLLAHLVYGFEQAGVIPESDEADRKSLEQGEWLWARLMNGVLGYGEPVCLILDASECLKSQQAWKLIDDVIRNAPPNMSVMVSGRRKPDLNLMRVLAAGELAEIDSRELSFTVDEVAQLLAQRGLSVGPGDAYHLRSETQGWPVGVLLFIAAFEQLGGESFLTLGDTRVCDSAMQFVKEYLIREVIDPMPADLQGFILRTAHVHAFNLILAAELTDDSQARNAIAALELQRGLLFRVGHSEWRAYHPMFRAAFCLVAQERLTSETRQLHEKTASWLLGAGRFGEGLYHYGQSHSLPSLLQLIEKHAFDLLREGEVNDIADTLQSIPVTVSQDHYVLAMIEASVVHVSKDVQRIRACIRKLQKLSDEHPGAGNPQRLRQTLAYLKSQDYFLAGDLRSSIRVCSDELNAGPSTDSLNAASSVLRFHRAIGNHAIGHLEDAYVDALQAHEELEQLGLSGYTNVVSMLLGQIELSRGQIGQAEERFIGAVSEVPGSAPGARNFYDVFGVTGLGLVRREQNRFEEAEFLLTEASNIAHRFKTSAALPWILLHIAMTAWAQGNKSRARELFREGQSLANRSDQMVVRRLLGAYGLRLEMDVGGLSSEYAQTLARELDELVRNDEENIMPEERLAMAWLRHYQGKAFEADKSCDEVADLASCHGQADLLIDSLLLRSWMLHERGEAECAMERLNAAISVCRDHGMRCLFFREGRRLIDFCKLGMSRKSGGGKSMETRLLDEPLVQELLNAQIEASAKACQEPGLRPFDHLTKRERDVLRLMTGGMSNQEIADALFVSVSTVKSHVNSIFKKLEVATREEACERASKFQLID